MDDDHCSRPVLMAKERTKYGRSDYERYDNATTDVGRAGRGKIGKVEVDCHFLFTKSRWGVIGSREIPAGIIYMDLDFHQPSDCKLESATVAVTLATEDGEECRLQPQDRPEPGSEPKSGRVKFTQHFGPHEMRGKETQVQSRRVKKRTPEVQVMGYGVGGMGLDNEKTVHTASRWRFSGRTTSDGGSIWDNRLQWELQENKLEREPTRPNRLHTAFAFEHNASRFYMTVTVSGKLAKGTNKMKSLLQFGKRKDGKPQEMVTKIEWVDGYDCPLRLDRLAQDLRLVMELENMSAIPIELPAAQLATFRPAASSSTLSGLGVSGAQQAYLPSSSGSTLGQEPEQPTPQAIEWQPLQTEQALCRPAQPTLEHMSQAAGFPPLQLTPPPPRPSPPAVATPVVQDLDQEVPASSSSTVVVQLPEPVQTKQDSQNETKAPEDPESKTPTIKIVPLPNPARPNPSALLFLLWLRNVSIEFLWMIAAMIPQAPVPEPTGKEEHETKGPTETQDGTEAVPKQPAAGEREQDHLRLTMPQQETPKDLDGETCIPSSGLTPRSGFSSVEQRRPWPHNRL